MLSAPTLRHALVSNSHGKHQRFTVTDSTAFSRFSLRTDKPLDETVGRWLVSRPLGASAGNAQKRVKMAGGVGARPSQPNEGSLGHTPSHTSLAFGCFRS